METCIFNKQLKLLRKEQSISQSELAKAIGTSQDTISLWERGKSYPDVIALIKLAKYFKVSTDYLLGLNNFE